MFEPPSHSYVGRSNQIVHEEYVEILRLRFVINDCAYRVFFFKELKPFFSPVRTYFALIYSELNIVVESEITSGENRA